MWLRFAPIVALMLAAVFPFQGAASDNNAETNMVPQSAADVSFAGGVARGLDLTASQEQEVRAYAEAMSRASIADICENQRKFRAKLRAVLTRQQLENLKVWEATNKSRVATLRDRLLAQKAVQAQQSTYNALVASETSCRETAASCAAAAHAVSIAASALQLALIEELATTQPNC